MAEKNAFDLERGDLKPSDFDEFLFAVDDVPLLGLTITKSDISSFEPATSAERVGIGLIILVISLNDARASDADLASYIISTDVSTIVVYQPVYLVSLMVHYSMCDGE